MAQKQYVDLYLQHVHVGAEIPYGMCMWSVLRMRVKEYEKYVRTWIGDHVPNVHHLAVVDP